VTGTGYWGLLRWVAFRAQDLIGLNRLEVGDSVRVSWKNSPLYGMTGSVVEINPGDPYGPYLLHLENGLRFRYRRYELAALTCSSDSATQDG
jgi:hypothetical protein